MSGLPPHRRKVRGGRSPRGIREELGACLRKRRAEIERKIVNRIRNMPEPPGLDDPSYLEGFRGAVAEAVTYGIECIEGGPEQTPPIPSGIVRQARRAARDGVRLDTVLRRYTIGNKLLEDFLLAEAENVPSSVLGQILSDQGPQVDRLMETVAAEYWGEFGQASRSPVQVEADRIVRLLESSSLTSPSEIDYDFDLWHLGVVMVGDDVENAARVCSERLGCKLLLVVRDRGIAWAWLGRRRPDDDGDLEGLLVANTPTAISLAVGRQRAGLDGWRLTHREAQIALQVTLQRPRRLTRARDVVLLAGTMRDDTLTRCLRDTYLTPLEEAGGSGMLPVETLRAYLSAGGNAAAAASALGVTRHTVQRRMKAIEELLGEPLHSCAAQLNVALQLDELASGR
jgi:hypothetical protein